MLCLSRKEQESVVLEIDGRVIATVKVILIDRNVVRLGFQAGSEVEIWREEIAPRRTEAPSA